MSRVEDHESAIATKLAQWALGYAGDDARVTDLQNLGGHSGDTWGFTCHTAQGPQALVVKFAPTGSAGAELMRQAPLLAALKQTGAKVAGVIGAAEHSDLFGSAFLIVERLPGQPLIMGPDAPIVSISSGERQLAHEDAARELAQIHTSQACEMLKDWDSPRSPTKEISHWSKLVERAAELEWAEECNRLGAVLAQTAPASWQTGLCHGDFQANNVLFEIGGNGSAKRVTVAGIVDWEIAHIGATDLDLAWFLMMNDASAWHPVEQRGGIDLDAVVRVYEAAAGRSVDALPWYRALASYRIAAIAGYKIRLHRTGRKIDDAWERASSSMPVFFARAYEMLETA